jgi:CHASE2 domain-containing sensor protein
MNVCLECFVRSIHDIHHGELTTISTTALFAASIHSWMRMEIKDDPLKTRSPLSTAGKQTLAALLVAAGGFVLQMVSGVTNTPTVPPLLVILLVAACLIALLQWWWMPVVGAFAGLFDLTVFLAMGRLLEPSPLCSFVGAWIMFLAVIVVGIAGIVATIQNYRTHP